MYWILFTLLLANLSYYLLVRYLWSFEPIAYEDLASWSDRNPYNFIIFREFTQSHEDFADKRKLSSSHFTACTQIDRQLREKIKKNASFISMFYVRFSLDLSYSSILLYVLFQLFFFLTIFWVNKSDSQNKLRTQKMTTGCDESIFFCADIFHRNEQNTPWGNFLEVMM